MVLLPKNRAPTHAGELLEELIEDFNLTQTEVAKRTAMPFPRVNEIVRGKRGITPDTALRLARLFGTTPDLWLNYQLAWDLWHVREESGAEIEEKVAPLTEAARSRGQGASALGMSRPAAGQGGGGAPYDSVTEFNQAARAPVGVRYSRVVSGRSRSRTRRVSGTASRSRGSARPTRSKKKN